METASREATIAEGLFSSADQPDWVRVPLWMNNEPDLEPFTMEELRCAETNVPLGKAPGLDGVFNKVLSAVVRWNPTSLLRILNVCLAARTFPKR